MLFMNTNPIPLLLAQATSSLSHVFGYWPMGGGGGGGRTRDACTRQLSLLSFELHFEQQTLGQFAGGTWGRGGWVDMECTFSPLAS